MMRLADYVMNRLAEAGVSHLFYVAGGQCVYLDDALRRSKDINPVAMHHEQAAAMAALAYGTYNNTLGACLVTTGCGGTNTLTGVLHAWQDSIPMVIISGQQTYSLTIKASGLPLRQVGIQEADTETIVKPITKYAVTVEEPSKIAYYMDIALHSATTGRKGPVWVDIPVDYQNAMVDEKTMPRFEVQDKVASPTEEEISYTERVLKNAKRPVIFAGNGVRSAGAREKLLSFAKENRVPVVFTRLSMDMMPYNEDMNFGIVASGGGPSRYANFIVQNADAVLIIGNRLSVDTIGTKPEQFAREATKIVVDIDKTEQSKNSISMDRLIIADAKEFLSKCCKMEITADRAEWLDKCRHWRSLFGYTAEKNRENGKIDYKLFMDELSERTQESTAYVSDAGITGAAAPAATRLKPGDRFIHSYAQGEMGFSLPGACGIAPLHDGPVVSYTGDGSFMMNLQELQTVVRNQYNIKIVIINNNGYSGVRHGQLAYLRGKSIGTDSSNGLDFPSFEKVAMAFGIKYIRIDSYDDFGEGLTKLFEDKEPVICEVMCDSEQMDLRPGLVLCDKRTLSVRPMEDLWPYIDREVFFREMIVEPLEESSGKPI